MLADLLHETKAPRNVCQLCSLVDVKKMVRGKNYQVQFYELQNFGSIGAYEITKFFYKIRSEALGGF